MTTLKFIITILVISFSFNSFIDRKINIKTIGWQFTLPKDFAIKDSTYDVDGNLIEEIPGNGTTLRIFFAEDSIGGSFSAHIKKDLQPFDAWKSYYDNDTKWFFNQMTQLTEYKIVDTNYFTKQIDNKSFLVQYAKLFRKDKFDTTYIYHYYGRIDNFTLDISFEYFKTSTGEKLAQVIRSSKFNN